MRSVVEQITEVVKSLAKEQTDLFSLARNLGVYEKTITNILQGIQVSWPTYQRLLKNLDLPTATYNEQKVYPSIDLQRDCEKILKSNLLLQLIAKQFKT